MCDKSDLRHMKQANKHKTVQYTRMSLYFSESCIIFALIQVFDTYMRILISRNTERPTLYHIDEEMYSNSYYSTTLSLRKHAVRKNINNKICYHHNPPQPHWTQTLTHDHTHPSPSNAHNIQSSHPYRS